MSENVLLIQFAVIGASQLVTRHFYAFKYAVKETLGPEMSYFREADISAVILLGISLSLKLISFHLESCMRCLKHRHTKSIKK